MALNEWRLEIERILAVMVEVFPPELRDTYLTTVVEQEVHNTVLMSQELAKRSIWVWRSTAQTEALDDDSTGLQEQRRRLEILQDNLKGQLAEKHILRVHAKEGVADDSEEHKQYTQDLAEKLDAHLRTTTNKIITEDLAKVLLFLSQRLILSDYATVWTLMSSRLHTLVFSCIYFLCLL